MPRLVTLALLLLAVPVAAGQPTNAEVLGALAADCLAEVPAPGAFVLTAPALPPYLRDALVPRWQARGGRVFADTAAAGRPRLTLDAPLATVAYQRAGRRLYARAIRLRMGYVLTGPDGEVLRTGTCDEAADDTVEARAHEALEDAAFPETRGTPPPTGGLRRYAEPVVLGVAVAVSTLLFFSLRSR